MVVAHTMTSISDKQQLLERLRASEQAFLAAINVSEAAAAVSPAEGCWSIRQVTEHLILVEAGTLKRLREASANANPPDMARDELVLKAAIDRSTPRNAPERARPTDRFLSLTEARSELQQRRQESIAFVASDTEDMRKKWVNHPLGDMDGHQLVLLLCQHMHRHVMQIDEIKQSAAYRAASNQKAAS
jgi:uncharacterized damage-inducible protein DinB